MTEKEKDVILVLGDGGMMGIFVAGVLAEINKHLRNRVSTIYGTSSGADVGVYFVSNQTDIPLLFFTEYLTKPDFIRKNFFKYLLKIFIFGKKSKIKDYLNVDYVAEVAKNSDCKLDLESFEKSDIKFYVKVIEIPSAVSSYLSAKTNVFEKLKATSQCGPLSTEAIEINGKKYIDGGTLPNRLDIELVKSNPDKLFIFVQSQKDNRFSKIILYPLYLLASRAITILYGKGVSKKYKNLLFTDYTKELLSYKNVIHIKNELCYSSFCTDKQKLQEVYEHGIEQAKTSLSI